MKFVYTNLVMQSINGILTTVIDEFYSVSFFLASIAYLIVGYIAFKHPQGLLRFEHQIIQAIRLYSKIREKQSADTSLGVN